MCVDYFVCLLYVCLLYVCVACFITKATWKGWVTMMWCDMIDLTVTMCSTWLFRPQVMSHIQIVVAISVISHHIIVTQFVSHHIIVLLLCVCVYYMCVWHKPYQKATQKGWVTYQFTIVQCAMTDFTVNSCVCLLFVGVAWLILVQAESRTGLEWYGVTWMILLLFVCVTWRIFGRAESRIGLQWCGVIRTGSQWCGVIWLILPLLFVCVTWLIF